MKILLQCLLFLGFNALAFSAEILAWKTPISQIDTGGKVSPGLVRLEKPPEASPLFGKDDELWSVSSIMPNNQEVTDKLEWAVWNATSGRLVAKGTWVALFELQHHYDLDNPPVQARVKLDAYQIPADAAPPDPSKPPSFSLSYIGRSGQKVVVSNTEGDSSINIESEMIIEHDRSLIDGRILTDISLPDSPTLKIDSSILLVKNSPTWLARNFNGKQGIDLMVTVTLMLADGTPFDELIMRHEGDEMKPFSTSEIHGGSGNIAIGEKHKLVWMPAPPDVLELLDNQQDTDPEEDPFAAQRPNTNNHINFKEVKSPEILKPHFYGMVFDIGDALKQNGIKISDKDFAGYDPKTQCVFMYSSDIAELDKFESLFMLTCCFRPANLAITARGDGELRLLARSGMKASLSGLDHKSQQTRSFEVEPTIGENNTIIDLRCTYRDNIGDKMIQSLDVSVTLESGKFLKVFENSKADGSKEAMEMKAEILDHGR
ncbi:MAG: hypothetical protein V4727_01475 [Verrucomicrobiota bacterium]